MLMCKLLNSPRHERLKNDLAKAKHENRKVEIDMFVPVHQLLILTPNLTSFGRSFPNTAQDELKASKCFLCFANAPLMIIKIASRAINLQPKQKTRGFD